MFSEDNGDFFQTVDFLSQLCGVYLVTSPSSIYIKIFHLVFDTVVVLFGIYFYVLELLMLRITIKDLKQFFRHVGMLSTDFLALLKFFFIMLNRKELSVIKEELQSKDFTYERHDNFDAEVQEAIARKTCQRFVIAPYFIYVMVGGAAHIIALWRLNSEQKGKYFNKNTTCADYTPYFFVVPFDTETTTSCRYALLLMDVGLAVPSFYMATYDTLLTSLMICLRTKLEIVSEATRTLRERVISSLNLPEGFELFQDQDFPEFENAMYDGIRKCNLHLALLFRASEKMENVFTLMTLLQTTASLCMMASNLFVLSLISYSDPEFFSLVQYILAAMCQLSVMCYFGSSVTEACVFYRRCLYECDWCSGSKRFKVCILIMLCRLEKPLYLTAGKFFPLTLGTVVSVLQASFSYAAVCKAVG